MTLNKCSIYRPMFLSIGLFFVLVSGLQAQDFKSLHLVARFDTIEEKVLGTVYHQVAVNEEVEQLVLNAIRMEIKSLQLNGEDWDYQQNDTALFIPLNKPSTGELQLRIEYEAKPNKGIYFIGWQDETRRARRQIWTQGQGIDHRHWIPHHDDQTDKILFSAEWIFNSDYQIMSNGLLDSMVTKEGENHWYYSMDKPMSSYLIAMALGNYVASAQMVNGTPHILYHYPDRIVDSAWYYYRHQHIASFLEEEINYEYPWRNYKQAPVMDFRHGAMENTCATIFGDFFLVDSIAFNDRNYTYVDAHEFAHQWFGNLVTAAGSEHHWLHEGFATYYQWLSEEELYGSNHYDWELFKARELIEGAAARDSLPLAHPKAGVERFYQKGGWLLHMLRNYVGDSVYRMVIDDYLNRYAHQVVQNEDLIALFEKHSDKDIRSFFDLWLYGKNEPTLRIRHSPIKEALVTDLSEAMPQQLEFAFLVNGKWRFQKHQISKGRSMILIPDSCTAYYLANVDDLLLNLEDESMTTEYYHIAFDANDELAARCRYMREWPQWEEDLDFIKSVAEDDQNFHWLRAEAIRAFVRISKDRNKEKAFVESLLRSTKDVQLQKAIITLVLKEKMNIDAQILADLRQYGGSYDLRSSALQASIDPDNLASMKWLNDAHWAEQPGIVGHNLYLQTLFYRFAFFRDQEALAKMLDFAGPSFDFNTRMNALSYLSYLPIDTDLYWQRLFEAFQNKNWKLSKKGREKLLDLQSKEAAQFKKAYRKAKRDWDDFQKRKAERTFEKE